MADAASDLTKHMRVIKAMFGLFTVAMIVLIVGLYVDSRQRVNDLGEIIDQQEADTAAARRGSCLQANEQARRSRDGNKEQLRVVIEGLTLGRPATPEGEARIAALYSAHDETIDVAFPDRDCTPEGIAEYLAAHDR